MFRFLGAVQNRCTILFISLLNILKKVRNSFFSSFALTLVFPKFFFIFGDRPFGRLGPLGFISLYFSLWLALNL